MEIRELVDAYAHCVDRHDTAGQLALFTEDADFVVYAGGGNALPTKRIRGRVALAPLCDQVNAYQATVHLNGQSITRVDGERAWGVTYCLAYQVKDDGDAPSLVTTAIRYLDSFVKREGRWLIRQRQVIVAWTETRSLAGR
jgi:ketosteroid isomerase-like protein